MYTYSNKPSIDKVQWSNNLGDYEYKGEFKFIRELINKTDEV